MGITFRCECGRRLTVKDEMAGKKGKCPGCGKVLPIPMESEPEVEEPAAAEETNVETRPCPHCTKPIPVDAVFCTACGTHLVTGEKHEGHKAEEMEETHGYDPLKLILRTVKAPVEVVGMVIDSPLSAQTFQRALMLFGLGAIGFVLMWSLNGPAMAGKEIILGTTVKWYFFPVLLVAAVLMVVVDAVMSNLAGQHFGSTGTTLAHAVIALLVLNGVWGLGCGVVFATGYYMPMIAAWVPWLTLLWAAYLMWAMLQRAYDMSMAVAATFAVGSAALKGMVIGLVVHFALS